MNRLLLGNNDTNKTFCDHTKPLVEDRKIDARAVYYHLSTAITLSALALTLDWYSNLNYF